jgi:predicted lipid-binding transport protein (Tim44 family)
MIVTAFAGGDKAALRPLLSGDVFHRFVAAIDRRAIRRQRVARDPYNPAR